LANNQNNTNNLQIAEIINIYEDNNQIAPALTKRSYNKKVINLNKNELNFYFLTVFF